MGAIIALESLKTYLSLGNQSADDDLLEDLIFRAEEAARNYCSRYLTAKKFTEVRNGNGGLAMPMREGPIISVDSLSIDGVSISASASSTASGYQFDDEALYLIGYKFTKGVRNVSVVYNTGYVLDSVPHDLKQAVIENAALAYRRRDHVDTATKAMAAESTTYITSAMTQSARDILQNYCRITPI